MLSRPRKSRIDTQTPAVIAISGFSPEVGKTALVCDLLRSFPDWEAIKTKQELNGAGARDRYACGVTELLSHEGIVQSGREQTYLPGQDTARYWDAGASNVHAVVAREEEIEQGLREALRRVTAPGVFIEGNSFTEYVRPTFMLMVAPADGGTIKSSARRAFKFASALYINNPGCASRRARQRFAAWLKDSGLVSLIGGLPIFTRDDLPELVAQVWVAQLDHSKQKDAEASTAA